MNSHKAPMTARQAPLLTSAAWRGWWRGEIRMREGADLG
jgi:hypothetical protein